MEQINTKECYIDKKKYTMNNFITNEKLIQKVKKGNIKLYDKLNNELIFVDRLVWL